MNNFLLILSLTVFKGWAQAEVERQSSKKDIPDAEYPNLITVKLVKKNWTPAKNRIIGLEWMTSDPSSRFPGTVETAKRVYNYVVPAFESCAEKLTDAVKLFDDSCGYNPNLDSIMLVQTIKSTAKDFMCTKIVYALYMRNLVRHYNIFAIDLWELDAAMRSSIKKQAIGLPANYKGISEAISNYLLPAEEIDVGRLNLFGYSYSGQLVYYIARTIRKKKNKKVKSILAIDPHSSGLTRLRYRGPSLDDAGIIHTYHTNSILAGTLRRGKFVDVEFNNGNFQPGCPLVGDVACSHQRALNLFYYVIVYPDLFIARKCSSGISMKWCRCKTEEFLTLSFPPSGDASGIYQIKTSAEDPFGLGEAGASQGKHCKTHEKDKTAEEAEAVEAEEAAEVAEAEKAAEAAKAEGAAEADAGYISDYPPSDSE